jgi:hypothetical protein
VTPSVVIQLALEARPRIEIHALHEADEVRLADWLAAHPKLLELYVCAIDAANERRAA